MLSSTLLPSKVERKIHRLALPFGISSFSPLLQGGKPIAQYPLPAIPAPIPNLKILGP